MRLKFSERWGCLLRRIGGPGFEVVGLLPFVFALRASEAVVEESDRERADTGEAEMGLGTASVFVVAFPAKTPRKESEENMMGARFFGLEFFVPAADGRTRSICRALD